MLTKFVIFGPLVQRGLSAELTGGLPILMVYKTLTIGTIDNPSGFALLTHLPLHKGGYGFVNALSGILFRVPLFVFYGFVQCGMIPPRLL